MATIAQFKAQMTGGGSRPNQFRVELAFPTFVGVAGVTALAGQFLCKATSLPASTLEDIQTFYRGRPVHFAGERTFAPWRVSIYNDANFALRNAFELWSGKILNYSNTSGVTNPNNYQVDMVVHHLDRNNFITKTYRFYDAYPQNIGEIALDFESNNQIELFDVDFVYNYFTVDSAPEASGGLIGVNTSVTTPVGTFPLPTNL